VNVRYTACVCHRYATDPSLDPMLHFNHMILLTSDDIYSHKLNMGCLTLGSCLNSFEGSVNSYRERERERELCDVKMEMRMSCD